MPTPPLQQRLKSDDVLGRRDLHVAAVARHQMHGEHAGVFLAVCPLLTAILAFLFGNERLTVLQWAGMAVAMVGIFLTQWMPEKKTT